MKTKTAKPEKFDVLEALANDTSAIRPLTPKLSLEWEAARRTGTKARPSRRQKESNSRIVPISIDSALLAAVDQFASDTGVTRSRLVAEALRLRMGK